MPLAQIAPRAANLSLLLVRVMPHVPPLNVQEPVSFLVQQEESFRVLGDLNLASVLRGEVANAKDGTFLLFLRPLDSGVINGHEITTHGHTHASTGRYRKAGG